MGLAEDMAHHTLQERTGDAQQHMGGSDESADSCGGLPWGR